MQPGPPAGPGVGVIRFLHSGDWQLGMLRRVLGDEARARFTDARFEAVRRLGVLAERTDCAFVVVCGDVFESNRVDRRTVARALEALAAVPRPVYLLPGNHDPLDAASVYASAVFAERRPAHVHVLDDARPREVAPGVELVGAPWTSKRPDRDLVAEAAAALAPARGTTRILAAHGAVDALGPERRDPARISLAAAEAAIASDRFHYLALGDRHSCTAVGSSDRIHYAGAPEPTDFDEIDPGKALVVEVDPARVSVTPHAVGSWRFVRRDDVALNGPDDVGALARWLEGFEAKERTLLRLGLVGSLDLRDAARLDALLDASRDLFASIERWEPASDLAVRPADADFESLDLAGFAAAGVARLRRQADAGGEAGRAAGDALALLVRLAGSAP